FEELPWFTRLRERGPELMEALERRHRRQGTLGRSFRRVADLRHGITVAAERVKAANGARPDDAAAEEEPVEAARRADAAAATAPPTKLTPDGTGPSGGGLPGEPAASPEAWQDWTTSVSERLLESIELVRAVGRASADLGTIVGGARRERGCPPPAPAGPAAGSPASPRHRGRPGRTGRRRCRGGCGSRSSSSAPSAGRARTSGRSSAAPAASGRCSVPAVSWTASWNPTSSTRRRWRARG